MALQYLNAVPIKEYNTRLLRDADIFAAFLVIFSIVQLILWRLTGAYSGDLGNHWDEAAHFVSSLTIIDYFRHGFGSNPIAFAKEYYAHFPKVAIGHWPPLFEGLQALILWIFGETRATALLWQSVLAAACAATVAYFTSRLTTLVEGICCGLAFAISRPMMELSGMVMADSLLCLLTAWTAVAWGSYCANPKWSRALTFSLCLSAAILTKGTAWGLVLLPAIYAIITGNIKILWNPNTLLAASLVAVTTIPWYAATYQMAADGFVYTWGWTYSRQAIPFFLKALVLSCGIPVIAGVLATTLPNNSTSFPERWASHMPSYAAATAAMLLFVMAAPADLTDRYLLPCIPLIFIIGTTGLHRLMAILTSQHKTDWRVPVAICLTLLLNSASMFTKPTVMTFHSTEIYNKIVEANSPNKLVLVSGGVRAEGAMVAAFAEKDHEKRFFVIRAQKTLARTNWMASEYSLIFKDSQSIENWLIENNVGWVAIDSENAKSDFPHNVLLKEALRTGELHAQLVASYPNRDGTIELYKLPAAELASNPSSSLFKDLLPGHLGSI